MCIFTMNKIIQYSDVYWDYRLSWATTAFFIGSVANASLKTVLSIPESLWGLMSAFFGVGILLSFALNFKEMLRRSSTIFLHSMIVFLLIYLLSAILILFRGEPLNQMVYGTAFLTFAWWIPVGVYAISVKNKSILYEVWVKASYIISFFAIMMYFFHIPNDNSSGGTEYNMAFGFYIILPLLIHINEFIRKKRFFLICLVLFEFFTVVIYANRGIYLSLFFFGIYKFAFESGNRLRKFISIIFLVVFIVLMLSSIETIAKNLILVMDSFGLHSRSVEMLASGVISDTSGRDELWGICYKMIEQKPILGWGLGGEYYTIGKNMGVIPELVTAEGCNPHNGIIQNFVCFGLLGGIIVNMLLLKPIFFLSKFRGCNHDLVLIFLSASTIPITISSAGFFIKPAVAFAVYLYYYRNHLKRA